MPDALVDEMPDVLLFPEWNDNVTAAQRLRELALMADKYPERFEKLFVGWIGNKNGKAYNNDRSLNMETPELLGWLTYWKYDICKRTSREIGDA